MHQALSKDHWRRSIRSIIFVVGVCLLVWLWGNHRKVDVDFQFLVQVSSPSPNSMALTFYDDDHAVTQELSLPVTPEYGTASYRLSLRPGKYTIHGIVRSSDGQKHVVEQMIIVPTDDATMTVYLRDH